MSFVRNAWYIAAWTHEIGQAPFHRIILGRPVVLFRDASGNIAALNDRCPHRAAPLHMGQIVEGALQCPYHGLRFDAHGHCVHNPHGRGLLPKNLSVQSYPLVERHGAVWIWPGDAERADDTLIPDYGLLVDRQRYTSLSGYMHVAGAMQLIVDNLLDLSHAEFLHAKTLSQPGSNRAAKTGLDRDGDSITMRRLLPGFPPSPLFKPLWSKTETVDLWSDMSWSAPGNLMLDVGVTEPGGNREDGLFLPSAHILTPETEHSTHYFWAFARNFALEDDTMTQRIRGFGIAAFETEDRPIIEAQQRNMLAAGLTTDSLVNFTSGDAAAMHTRKVLQSLRAAETAAASTN